MCRTETQADQAAERSTDDDHSGKREVIEQGDHIGDVTVHAIATPVGVAIRTTAAAQIGREDAPRFRQLRREIFEVAAIARESGQTHDGREIGGPARRRVLATIGAQTVAQHEAVLDEGVNRAHFANKREGSRNALNSSALPEGS